MFDERLDMLTIILVLFISVFIMCYKATRKRIHIYYNAMSIEKYKHIEGTVFAVFPSDEFKLNTDFHFAFLKSHSPQKGLNATVYSIDMNKIDSVKDFLLKNNITAVPGVYICEGDSAHVISDP